MPTIELLGVVALAIVIFYGGNGVFAGNLSLGALVAFISYVKMFFRPIRDIAEKYNILQNAMASAERIFLILDNNEKLPYPVQESEPLPVFLEKNTDFTKVPNGIIGLETSVPLSLKLVETGVLSMETLIYKMASAPAHILGLKSGLKVGNPADITILDPAADYTVDSSQFRSLSRNTPFDGWQVQGHSVLTMVGGAFVYNRMT